MAAYSNRMSTYSNVSAGPRPQNQASTQVSTTTLLNALHTSYTSSQPYFLEPSTSLVVNTWVTAANLGPDGRYGGTVDVELGRKAWEHARRRAEDGCIVLCNLHESAPCLFAPFISALPLSVPAVFYTSLDVVRAFTHCVTPHNASAPRYSSLGATFAMSLAGNITGASLALSTSGLDTSRGLINVPSDPGYRAFDVFYYLTTSSASQAEREALNLKPLSSYSLLNKSNTYRPPSYLISADDEAAAEDFRSNLRAIGIKGKSMRNLIAALTALLKLGDSLGFLVDQEVLADICQECAPFLDLSPEVLQNKCDTLEREVLISAIYEAIVDWVIAQANIAIRQELRGAKIDLSSSGSDFDRSGAATPRSSEEDGDTVSITVVDIPDPTLSKAVALRNVFDDTQGINLEMKEDGVEIIPAGSSVLREMNAAIAASEADLGISSGPLGRERELERDRREGVLEKLVHHMPDGTLTKEILLPTAGEGIVLGKHGRFELPAILSSSRVWFQLSLHPTDESPANLAHAASTTSAWSAASVSSQLRTWRLPEWSNRRNKNLEFTADFDLDEFIQRYSRLGCKEGRDGVESWAMERGWSNGEVVIGNERIWIRESAWWEAETMLDLKPIEDPSPANMLGGLVGAAGMESGYSVQSPGLGGGFFGPQYHDEPTPQGSRDNLLQRQQSSATMNGARSVLGARSLAPTAARTMHSAGGGDYGLGRRGDDYKGDIAYDGFDPELADGKVVEEQPISGTRKIWVAIVWALTFWIPSPLLSFVGRMRRPDIRMAWREKVVLVFVIFLINAAIVFYIIFLGRLLCPDRDKVWNEKEVSYHQGKNDFWVSHRGVVYDISSFWRQQHSDINVKVTDTVMEGIAGKSVDNYIVPPLTLACPGLVKNPSLQPLQFNTSLEQREAVHISGKLQPDISSELHHDDWYSNRFLPRMREYRKGRLVISEKKIRREGRNDRHMWFTMGDRVYDLTDYFHTIESVPGFTEYEFLDPKLVEIVQSNPGGDITEDFRSRLNRTARRDNLECLSQRFYVGRTDIRDTPKCQVNNWLLLAFTLVICAVILVKFLAALQLGSKRRPSPQDKFVICQVPAYTEGEDHLRKGLDSLTALAYDNKRKLICVICDGMIVGGGNDRPTPKIVLDILGVDPKIDPPALPFRSVGQGSEQLNYGKVYSGLYEYEGNVVPYLVVVKVGKESEQGKSKPGNRGKRDSQVLLMSFLNRVHHRSSMNPLELEMFHQINNIIGVDPELYEYLFMVDADTMVKEDSLTRLVASCANDAKIAGICGETSLENEERSWWTMIQVYEYYISHHLAKAFESLFGSVTCLPGCFCMYRLRTADKGRPLIISDKVINEYSDIYVDTLHKKNLLSLGEDRYLTTLMTKHFPQMSYKFVPDAKAQTAAPETWSILLSQRRRWINSTIHNLCELVFLKDMCGFCCFSMRFVVFIDLTGTIILPATCVYLGYLIYTVSSGTGQFPMISIVMLAAVYGLQAIIFIIKRQWQHIGWMIIYLIAFPVYSFALPIYSFWKQDDFSWGNTRIVIGEKGNNKIVAIAEDERFDPRSIPLQRWDDYATANNLPGRRGVLPGAISEKGRATVYEDGGFEMDDMQSLYGSVKPASTILTGFPGGGHMPPQSPAFGGLTRQSTYSNFNRYTDNPVDAQQSRLMSMGNMSDVYAQNYPYGQHRPSMGNQLQSSDNLMTGHAPTPPLNRGRSPLGFQSRPQSTVNFMGGPAQGPTDAMITEAVQACLREVDLDNVTKKQLKALAEQRLQTQLSGERRIFLDQTIDFELANM